MSLFLKLLAFAFFPTFFLLVLQVSRVKRLASASHAQKNPPPSPWKLPFIGNLHQLALGNHRSFKKLSKKYGPLMLMNIGSVPVLVASSVDAAREILKTHESMFLNRLESSNIRKISHDFKDVTFCAYGDYWRYSRSLIVQNLLSNKKVLSYRRVREEEVALMMELINESSGSIISFSDLICSHYINVFSRVALGRKYDWKEVKDLIEQAVELTGLFMVGDYIPLLSFLDKLRCLDGRIENHTKQFDQFLEGVIEDHLHRKILDSVESKSTCMVDQDECFIDKLLEEEDETHSIYLQRDNVKALLMDMFIAATNQPFASLEWTLSELVRNPQTMIKLQEEVRLISQGKPKITEDDLGKLHYMHAVFKESLRLHPLLTLIPRESTQDVKIMGYDIEAKTKVFINIWAMARDPTLWEEPEEFRPERFLNSPIDYKGSYFEYIPFGAGRRGCPGIQYAKTINELTLANMVYKFDLALPNRGRVEDLDMTEHSGALVARKNNLLLVATPHSIACAAR